MTAILTLPTIDDTSRRTFLTGGLSLAGLIAAFRTTAPAPDATPDAGDGFPVTIEHQFGDTTIAQPPERVVSVGLTDHDTLLALEIKPSTVLSLPYALDRLPPLLADALDGNR